MRAQRTTLHSGTANYWATNRLAHQADKFFRKLLDSTVLDSTVPDSTVQ